MKKVLTEMTQKDDNDMRSEYDFAEGVRGKHCRAMRAGYTVIIHQADGSTVLKEVTPKEGVVVLEPDVQRYFPDSESVNAALRGLIKLIPEEHTMAARKGS